MSPNNDPRIQGQLMVDDLLFQLDPQDPLLKLSRAIEWSTFDKEFAKHYSQDTGRPSIPIRRRVGLLILKHLENLSDENVVLQYKRNPYYQAFCGALTFERRLPCHATELVHFRKRIGKEGVGQIFEMSVNLHGRLAEATEVNIDITVQEKNMT